jgi:uncharacterized protein YndB with AHSA1/START domain
VAQYSFATVWQLDAPIEALWAAIYDVERYPSWWKYVKSVTPLEAGDENGLGARWRNVWATQLPYNLVFNTRTTRVERPHLLELAADGELAGTGRWQLSQEGNVTTVRYDWRVSTTKPWMNLLAPIARPAFAWNHNAVMGEGGRGLARLVGARLLQETHSMAP